MKLYLKGYNSDDNNSYNPYICAHDKAYLKTSDFTKSVMGSLNMTLGAISDEYKQLKIIKNKEILDNIIYLGLSGAYDGLFENNGGKHLVSAAKALTMKSIQPTESL